MGTDEIPRVLEMHDGFWLEEGRYGDPVPIYWNRLCERAAIEAYLCGDWGALMLCEIEFMREAEEDEKAGGESRWTMEVDHE